MPVHGGLYDLVLFIVFRVAIGVWLVAMALIGLIAVVAIVVWAGALVVREGVGSLIVLALMALPVLIVVLAVFRPGRYGRWEDDDHGDAG